MKIETSAIALVLAGCLGVLVYLHLHDFPISFFVGIITFGIWDFSLAYANKK